jgi:hypothetical protein
MPASRINICNQAIDIIKAKRIQSLTENSLEARVCNTHYPQMVSEMLEGAIGNHTFSFANRRGVLAVVTNDRSHEWAFAYAVPADMGNAVAILPDFEGVGLGLPVPLPGQPYAETWAGLGGYEAPYRIENGVIYTDIENATLEYGINDIEEAVLPAQLAKAMVSDLASRLAVPVKGDSKLKRALQEEADLYWQRAIADDKNRNPERSGEYVSEAQAARAGWLTSPLG